MSVDGYFKVEAFHYSDMGSEVVITLNADTAAELAMVLPTDDDWKELSAELLEAVVDIDRKATCTHNWVNMQNEHIYSGLWCPKCNAVSDAFTTESEAKHKFDWLLLPKGDS